MVKIKSMIRKSVNCLVTLSLMFFVFLFVYACSSDAVLWEKRKIGMLNHKMLWFEGKNWNEK